MAEDGQPLGFGVEGDDGRGVGQEHRSSAGSSCMAQKCQGTELRTHVASSLDSGRSSSAGGVDF
jgi:hypothetical protein